MSGLTNSGTIMLKADGLYKRFGALAATDDLNLDVRRGEIHALIGPNGAGKSTLVAQLAGELRSDSGTVTFEGHDVTALPPPGRVAMGLVRSFQITSIFKEFDALTNVTLAVQAHQGHSFRFWGDARKDRSLIEPALHCLEQAGLAGRAHSPATQLSYGEQRQLEIAMALATKPKMLLLDEPLAGMGREDGQVIVDLLGSLRQSVTMLLIEHDMDAVFQLADRISVLVYGHIIATGTPEEIRHNPEVQRAYLGEEAHAGEFFNA